MPAQTRPALSAQRHAPPWSHPRPGGSRTEERIWRGASAPTLRRRPARVVAPAAACRRVRSLARSGPRRVRAPRAEPCRCEMQVTNDARQSEGAPGQKRSRSGSLARDGLHARASTSATAVTPRARARDTWVGHEIGEPHGAELRRDVRRRSPWYERRVASALSGASSSHDFSRACFSAACTARVFG